MSEYRYKIVLQFYPEDDSWGYSVYDKKGDFVSGGSTTKSIEYCLSIAKERLERLMKQ